MTIIEHIGTTYVILRRSMMSRIRQRSSVLLDRGEGDLTLQDVFDLVKMTLFCPWTPRFLHSSIARPYGLAISETEGLL